MFFEKLFSLFFSKNDLLFVPKDWTNHYRSSFPGFCGDQVLVCYPWTDAVHRKIHLFKYKSSWILADTFVQDLSALFPLTGEEIVVPLASYRWQYFLRGRNHAAFLAKKYARKNAIPYCDVLQKVRSTQRQALLSRAQRCQNLAGAFRCIDAQKIHNKTVLIIDDVITTGATFHEMAAILKKAGAKKVIGLFLSTPNHTTKISS